MQYQIFDLIVDTKTDIQAEIIERHIFKNLKLLIAQNWSNTIQLTSSLHKSKENYRGMKILRLFCFAR